MATESSWQDLNLLQDLDVLLEVRHVTAAAKIRGITQSAMSARLAKLRLIFDDSLLVDGRPKLILTARAEALRAPLSSALGQLTHAMTKAMPFEPVAAVRTFVIVGGDSAEAIAVPRLIAQLRASAPHVAIQMRRSSSDLQVDLGERGGDLAFEPISRATGSLRSFRLTEDSFVVMMAKGHPLAGKRITLDDYLEYPHVLVAPTGLPGSLVDDALAKIGKSRRVVAVLRHFVSAPIVVARSDALLTCPTSLVQAVEGLLPVVTTQPPVVLPSYVVGAIWHERCHDDPAHIWLRSVVRSCLASEP